ARAMDTLRHVCSEIGFINEVSIASLDDDLLRLRSSSVDDLGLTRIRNPKKGFGPVQHGIVSLVTEMKVGSKNEDNISSRLPVWFREQTQYDLKHTKSYGLLCRPDMKYLAFSPGGVGMFSSPETQDFFAILEYKTRTTPVTIAKEAAIATKNGLTLVNNCAAFCAAN
ncbi:hypothetical protein PF005_g29888, partial [Phytophthora fragariae]